MGLTPEQLQFLREHRLAIIAPLRRDGRPHLTPVYYAVEDDSTLIATTTRDRAKAKLLRRDPRVSVCVVQEGPPFRYVSLAGRAEVTEEGVVDVLMRVNANRTRRTIPPEERPLFEERARNEGRVVLRIHIEEVLPEAR